MKRIILSTVVLLSLLSLTSVGQNSDNVSINVKLYPIHILTVNPSEDNKNVNLEYKTELDYQNGVSNIKNGHINVYSTGGFEIRVKSNTVDLVNNNPGINGNLNVSTIDLTPSSNESNGEVFYTTPLSTNESTLITSSLGTINSNYNVEYKGKGGNTYLNHFVSGQNPTVYSTTLTYTIIGK